MLAGCESLTTLQLPSFGLGKEKEPEPITLKLESDPPGAEAKLSTGATCVTPCALPVGADRNIDVSFSLARYQPRSVAVRSIAADKNFIGMEYAPARFEAPESRLTADGEPGGCAGPSRSRRTSASAAMTDALSSAKRAPTAISLR